MALVADVAEVLVGHGFPAPVGAALVDLTWACTGRCTNRHGAELWACQRLPSMPCLPFLSSPILARPSLPSLLFAPSNPDLPLLHPFSAHRCISDTVSRPGRSGRGLAGGPGTPYPDHEEIEELGRSAFEQFEDGRPQHLVLGSRVPVPPGHDEQHGFGADGGDDHGDASCQLFVDLRHGIGHGYREKWFAVRVVEVLHPQRTFVGGREVGLDLACPLFLPRGHSQSFMPASSPA